LLALAVAFMVLVAPIWIIGHYVAKARASRGLAVQDEKLLADLWEAARRMEERLSNLERVMGPEPVNSPGRVRETARG
jgi:phage shock protein B